MYACIHMVEGNGSVKRKETKGANDLLKCL